MSSSPRTTISAQLGPQTEFLRTAADICIYGGAAGGGKTVGLILEPLRHVGRIANSPTGIGRILDKVEAGPTIGQDSAEFAVEIGVVRRQASNGPGDRCQG